MHVNVAIHDEDVLDALLAFPLTFSDGGLRHSNAPFLRPRNLLNRTRHKYDFNIILLLLVRRVKIVLRDASCGDELHSKPEGPTCIQRESFDQHKALKLASS
jgi:hypothetical protein